MPYCLQQLCQTDKEKCETQCLSNPRRKGGRPSQHFSELIQPCIQTKPSLNPAGVNKTRQISSLVSTLLIIDPTMTSTAAMLSRSKIKNCEAENHFQATFVCRELVAGTTLCEEM